jgi:tetratricopeptide (TPR) repeat protein
VGLQTFLRANPAAPAGVLVVLLWLAWAWNDGGFAATAWGSVGSVLLVLLATALALRGDSAFLTRGRAVMFAALAAFVLWNFLSMTWADFPGEAWIGSAKTLLYAASFVVFALWPWDRRGGTLILAVFAGGVALIGAATLVEVLRADAPAQYFQNDRLAHPVGYVNATVALWTSAALPALYLAGARTLHAGLRGFFLGASVLLASLAVLGQSRAWLIFMPFVAALFVVLARQRLRALLALTIVAAANLAILDPVLQVFRDAQDGLAVHDSVVTATKAIAAGAIAAGLAGTVWAIVDSRVRLQPRMHRVLAVAAGLAVVVGVSFAATRAYRAVDDPHAWAAAKWDDFRSGSDGSFESSRFTGSFGSNRSREWRVAWLEFRDHPIAGIGSDNYQAAFLIRRTDSDHEPRYPHSIPLRLLSQLGIVGTAIFLVYAGTAVALALGLRRRVDPVTGGIAGVCLATFGYWLLHGSVDWFWEVPALAAPAFGLLGLATSTGATGTPREQTRRGTIAIYAAAACVAALVALTALPWLAESYQNAGAAVWRRDLDVAYARLDRAAQLNRVAATPLVVKGSIALRTRDLAEARRSLEAAIEREPDNWYAHFQLALTESLARAFPAATVEIERARELNPLDPVVADAAKLIARRRTPNPERLNSRFLVELNRRFGRNVADPTR